MLKPIRRHTKQCKQYGTWGTDCPSAMRNKCPLIVRTYPDGKQTDKSLGTNDETLAWQLVREMVLTGNAKPKEPPRTVKACVDDFLTLEQGRGVSESTLKSFRKFLCGSPKRDPNGNYSPTLVEFAATRNVVYLKDCSTDFLARFEASWKVQRHALKVQHERLRQFFKYAHDHKWIEQNPATALKAPNVRDRPRYAFPEQDAIKILETLKDNSFLLTLNLVMRYSGAAPVDVVQFKPENLHGQNIVFHRQKTGARCGVRLPQQVIERLRALPVLAGGYWFWQRESASSKHETATGNLRRMMRPYFEKSGICQKDEHGKLVIENGETVQAVFYQWRHTFVYERLKAKRRTHEIALLIGDSEKTLMEHYAHYIKEFQPELDATAESSWDLAELANY